VETIKTADDGYVRLNGYRPKSVRAGLGCSLGCTPAPSEMIAPLRRQMWCYVCESTFMKTKQLASAHDNRPQPTTTRSV